LFLRNDKVKLNVKNTQSGQLNNARYDDVLEDMDSILPEEISDDENNEEEEGAEDDGDENINDYDNYGLGIGNDYVLDTQTNQTRDPESFEFIFEDLEFLAEVTKLMKKVRGLISTVKNSTNILRYIRERQKLLGLTFQLIQDFKIR
jgi:hypothetical protein